MFLFFPCRDFIMSDIILVLMKKLFSAFTLFFMLFFVGSVLRVTYAYDAQCVGEGVGAYIDGVMSELDPTKLQHIQFLSPAFNMTESQFPELAEAMAAAAGESWNKLNGVSGNAYNTFWGPSDGPGTIMDWVDNAYSAAPEAFSGKKWMLTEIGWHELLYPGNG